MARKKKEKKTEAVAVAEAPKVEAKPDTTSKMIDNLGKTTAVVFSFDTTGSMQPCIAQVRKKLRDLVEKMTADIPDLKVGLIAHGDYCDGANAIHYLDLTNDVAKIMTFINDVPNTGGGDAPECYELALNRARSMSWPKEGGSLVLIGDDVPHEPDYPANTDKLDWRVELAALKTMNVSVFPLQCLGSPHRVAENQFWESVSAQSDTPLLLLEDFSESSMNLESVAYATAGVGIYADYLAATSSSSASASASTVENRSRLMRFASERAE